MSSLLELDGDKVIGKRGGFGKDPRRPEKNA